MGDDGGGGLAIFFPWSERCSVRGVYHAGVQPPAAASAGMGVQAAATATAAATASSSVLVTGRQLLNNRV